MWCAIFFRSPQSTGSVGKISSLPGLLERVALPVSAKVAMTGAVPVVSVAVVVAVAEAVVVVAAVEVAVAEGYP